MDMQKEEFVQVLQTRAIADPYYNTLLAKVRALEPEFLAVRDTLSREQQETLDRYISACEELEYSLCLIAYGMQM